jgi:TonB-linked SusC/RagA family outer membrane protein
MTFNVREGKRGRSRFARPKAWTGLLVFAFMAMGSTAADAQTGQITGTVSDARSSAPVSQAQIYLVGLQQGSLSRADGRFLILNIPAGTYTLRAERIGFGSVEQSVTVTSGGTTVADLTLESQALGLDEIVVTGAAGQSRRREIGNSIAQINVGDRTDLPASTTSLLQAAAPGIEVTGSSGQAGMGKAIRLRGNSSVSMTNQPIIYVDGVRMMASFPRVQTPGTSRGRGGMVVNSPLDNINPNDIERIEVIKGSAATTLFGTEASAGVIQIFTKRGSQGAPVWTAEVQQGTGWTQKFGVNGNDYLNMEHFMRDAWWGGGYEGGSVSADCVTDDERWGNANSSAEGACSWPGAQSYQNYYLSVRGGGGALQYFVSGSYQDDQYALPSDALKKYNVQSNFTMSPVNDLQIQWSTGYTNQWQSNTPSGGSLDGLELHTFRSERNYFSSGDPRVYSAVLDYDSQAWVERVTSGITVNYSPLANLTNRLTLGYDYASQEGRNLQPFGFWSEAKGSLTNDLFAKRILTFDYVGSYNFPITGDIRSNFSWGGQAIGDDLRHVRIRGKDFPGAAEPTVTSASDVTGSEERQKVWNAGFFLQNVFDISDKYFITVGARVDGNSAFGSGFGLQTYPKASLSWVISDEDFWPESLGSMKVRSAYGESGRAPGAFDAVRTWEQQGFGLSPAFIPENLGNPDLGPEVTAEFEVGFDAAFLNDRLDIGFTYYDQTTNDALMNVSAIPSNGFTQSQLQNVGKIGNSGLELQVNAALYESASWGVDLGLGVATNKSEVLDLGGNDEFNDLNGRIALGYSVPHAYDRRVANRDEIAPFEYENGGENVFIGPVMPTHYVTPSLTLRFPGSVTLAARGEYRGGNVMEVNPISVGRSVRSPLCFPYYVDPATSNAVKADAPALWRERCDPANADDYWFDADYFKLRSVSLTAPVDFAFPDRVSNATLTVALNNAFDWYREIPWYDAEILGGEGANGDFGAASLRTPAPATLRVSLRVTF